jgi:gluconokinase
VSHPLELPAPTRHVVVMGVSGSGKTTVAHLVAARTGMLFAEADDFHSRANVEKMRTGTPLTDNDRWPWLRDLANWMAERAAEGRSTVITCSALKRTYRDVLGDGPPSLDFVHLDGPREVIHERMKHRTHEYMPSSLLDSQIDALEPLQPDESGIVLDLALTPNTLAAEAIERLDLPVHDHVTEV